MRLLHTGDWHIGKRLYGNDRIEEAVRVLDEVARVAQAADVDAVLVAGDNLDRRLVEPGALATCLHGLEALAAVAPVVAVTGNHEDPTFWAQLAPYLAPRITLAASDQVAVVDTAAGRLVVGCVTWPDPSEIPAEPGIDRDRSRERYQTQVRERIADLATQVRRARREGGGVAVLLGHLMVSHGLTGGGERELTLGGTYALDGGSLPTDLDYVALGHLHRPQPLPAFPALGRYAGSPMALDFSGDGVAPSVAIVDIGPNGSRVTEVPIESGRKLVRIRGRIGELEDLASHHPDAWFFCEVVVDALRLDLVREVRDRVPGALRVEPILPAGAALATLEDDAVTNRDPADAYAEWLELNGRGGDTALVDIFRVTMAQAEAEIHP